MSQPYQIRVGHVAVSYHNALDSTGIQGSLSCTLGAVDREVDVHQFYKRQEPLVERPPSRSNATVPTTRTLIIHAAYSTSQVINRVVQRNVLLNVLL